ncbi:hypothetical protein KOR42_15080 [Thalassoglobus neptunius]|uniref:DUF1552 domain-containing protein n=1 Tax=Thalassoglobus neptunius TaxID=1938619 RepID=A0A5C5X4U8_9PLAN|nr:DUF1552 domain-containing protein [Thalassoglobus neptunius]TWT58137.1 hypothetical protein KOR42_15080 [Thalassoglobus neptunius]
MTIANMPLSRRAALRGLGVSLTLPFLESVAPRLAMASGQISKPPVRMAYIFVPNGVHLDNWTPKEFGYGYELPYILQPLSRVRDDMLVVSGLTHDKGRANGDGPGDHARSASVFLTGAQPRKTDGSNIRSGVSVDQVAANLTRGATRFASLELGCEPGRTAGNCDSGYSCAYSSSISWSSSSTPLGKETNPRSAFERLFSQGSSAEIDKSQKKREMLRKSVLDFVSDDAKRLQNRLGRDDQKKLDEYLTGVREIERRIERANEDRSSIVDIDYPIPEGVPGDYTEHLRLMCDMMVLAFQTDSTRIATCMFADAGSNRSYRHINVNDGHHDLSHHQSKPEKLAKISEINRFHVAQLAYLLEKMKATPDGESNLLDNTMVCYGSGLSDGNRHNNENLPVIVAGRAGGTIDTGRHLAVPTETPMCNLFMSMLDRFGTPVDFIGDSTGRVPGLQI